MAALSRPSMPQDKLVPCLNMDRDELKQSKTKPLLQPLDASFTLQTRFSLIPSTQVVPYLIQPGTTTSTYLVVHTRQWPPTAHRPVTPPAGARQQALKPAWNFVPRRSSSASKLGLSYLQYHWTSQRSPTPPAWQQKTCNCELELHLFAQASIRFNTSTSTNRRVVETLESRPAQNPKLSVASGSKQRESVTRGRAPKASFFLL